MGSGDLGIFQRPPFFAPMARARGGDGAIVPHGAMGPWDGGLGPWAMAHASPFPPWRGVSVPRGKGGPMADGHSLRATGPPRHADPWG